MHKEHLKCYLITSAFKNNKREAIINKKKVEYYYTSMTPANWYQWFDPQQPDDGPWTQVPNSYYIILIVKFYINYYIM